LTELQNLAIYNMGYNDISTCGLVLSYLEAQRH